MASKLVISAISLGLTFGVMAVVGWALWDDWDSEQEEEKTQPTEIRPGVYYTPVDTDIALISDLAGQTLGFSVGAVYGRLGDNVPFTGLAACPDRDICGQWPDGARVWASKSSSESPDLTCATVQWSGQRQESGRDCYYIGDNQHWYGGFEEYHQAWPMSGALMNESAFVTGNAWTAGQYGGVIEPLFVSSAGVGIYVHDTTPLYLSINQRKNQICLKGVAGEKSVFTQDASRATLRYDICKARDITTLWKAMARKYLQKPQSSVSSDVLTNPIWCTWAKYKAAINQTQVLDSAMKINASGYGASQLEIDDNWTPKYGDMTFDPLKFPDAGDMIMQLSDMGIPVTVWVHPFFNKDSDNFALFSNISGLVLSRETGDVGVSTWWRGEAGLLDVTQPQAKEEFLRQLRGLRQHYNVTSFKFDAGEVNWLPQQWRLSGDPPSPNLYSHQYVSMASQADPTARLEVRTAYHNQRDAPLVRMLDRASNWSRNRGIKTVIPCALTFGLMGYPFVLPDIIGGNAMDQANLEHQDAVVKPDKELYIRWLQLTAFLPVLQFSVAPWDYKDRLVSDVAAKVVNLHRQWAPVIVELGERATSTGEPIVRPLWWNDPQDATAMTVDTEFLLGDDLLVAPVLEKGQRSRDIYLPSGRWLDRLNNVTLTGPGWQRNFTVPLEDLAYFTRVK